MALHYGHTDELKKLRNEIEDSTKKILQYTLKYSAATLNLATYSERETSGYKYLSTHELGSKSTITLLTHSFSTSTGVNTLGGNIL